MKEYLLAVFAVFCWSFNVVAASVLVGKLTPWQIAALRWIIPSFIIFPFTFNILRKNIKVILKHKIWLIWTAFWGITISNTCVYYAAYSVNPVTLSLIGATGPLFLIFFSWVIKKTQLYKEQIYGLLITLIGVCLIVMHGRMGGLGLGIAAGDWWMLITAITFGYYSFLVANKPPQLPHLPLLACCLILGALFCLPMFVWDTIYNPLNFKTNFTQEIIWIVMGLGVFNSLIAYLCWNHAMDKADPVKVGMIYYLMPVFSTLESWLILGEGIHPIHVIGAIIIFIGIFYSNKKPKSALFRQSRRASP
ncbi:MAG: DMT family transporter [Alphaproteobacteria bacterium]|nr:DMT family transporter [Alphaproteobacteria bacterium]